MDKTKFSKIDKYCKKLLKKSKEDGILDDHYIQEATKMLARLWEAKHARIIQNKSGIFVVVGNQYYGMEKEINVLIKEHTDNKLCCYIEHHDHWSGDDHDVAYLGIKVKNITNKVEVYDAFKTLKKFAPNIKITVAFTEEWE